MYGKKILLGICGSIAAYKTPHLIRQLVKKGAEVKVVCTKDALNFVSALSLATVSKNKVISELENEGEWINHVRLAHWADLILIAPCSANTLSKIATGNCDNALMAVYMSAKSPVMVAPAMDEEMYIHPSTQNNIDTISLFPNHIVLPVDSGDLASGLVGLGRMLDIEKMANEVNLFFDENKKLKNQKILITAGPTYEMIDPVRFIGNFSTGKMGIALANQCAMEGAEVHLVLGPTDLMPQKNAGNISVYHITSADEMYNTCLPLFASCDIAICSAAVADYKPETKAVEKIKKSETEMTINLVKTQDILASLGKLKTKNQFLIGFALETENELDNAKKKLNNKNADMIVLNSLKVKGAGFGTDTNKVWLVKNDSIDELELMSKDEVAKHIIQNFNINT